MKQIDGAAGSASQSDGKGLVSLFDGVLGIRRLGIFLYILLLAATLPLDRFDITFSLFFGGLAAIFNFTQTEKLGRAILNPGNLDPSSAGKTAVASFYIRLTLFGATLYYTITAGWINAIALVIGLSIPMVSIFLWYLIFEHNKYGRKAI